MEGGYSSNNPNYSLGHINGVIFFEAFNCSRKFTGFYGHPEVHKRKESWDPLRHLATLTPASWLCMGDFNEIVEDAEKRELGGAHS